MSDDNSQEEYTKNSDRDGIWTQAGMTESEFNSLSPSKKADLTTAFLAAQTAEATKETARSQENAENAKAKIAKAKWESISTVGMWCAGALAACVYFWALSSAGDDNSSQKQPETTPVVQPQQP